MNYDDLSYYAKANALDFIENRLMAQNTDIMTDDEARTKLLSPSNLRYEARTWLWDITGIPLHPKG